MTEDIVRMLKAEINRLKSLPEIQEREELRKLKSSLEFAEKEKRKLQEEIKDLSRPFEENIICLRNELEIVKNQKTVLETRLNTNLKYQEECADRLRTTLKFELEVERLKEENAELRKNGGVTDWELEATPGLIEKQQIKINNAFSKAIEQNPNIPIYSSFVKMLLEGEHFKFGMTFTYVIRGAADCVFKIGKSKNPFKRVTNLADERGEALCIYAISPFDVEKQCHHYFREYRVKSMFEKSNEWFNLGQNPMGLLKKYSEENGWGFIVLPQPISTTRNGTV